MKATEEIMLCDKNRFLLATDVITYMLKVETFSWKYPLNVSGLWQ